MSIAKNIIEAIKKLTEIYEVAYYVKVGEHGSAGGYPTFERALDAANKLSQEDKDDLDTWYVGVEGDDKFAVVLIRDEYLTRRMGLKDFADEKTYNKWLVVAKKALETGKPQIGKW